MKDHFLTLALFLVSSTLIGVSVRDWKAHPPTIGQKCWDAGTNDHIIWRGPGANPFNICANMYKETYPTNEEVWAVEIPHQEYKKGEARTTVAIFFDQQDAIRFIESYPYVKRVQK